MALIAAQPDGLGIDAITQLQGRRLTRRTLQRRLAMLVKQGRIQMLGEARAVRYVCTAQVNKAAASIQVPLEIQRDQSPRLSPRKRKSKEISHA
ncbi:MAG: hypothetical protein ACYC4S_15985 [Rhodoferax sp.]